jgi:hypothetical protein
VCGEDVEDVRISRMSRMSRMSRIGVRYVEDDMRRIDLAHKMAFYKRRDRSGSSLRYGPKKKKKSTP